MTATGETIILLTGFGAFPGARSNPTAEIVRRLARSRRLALLGVKVEARILPVVYGLVEAELRALIVETRPDVIIHLGLAGRRKALSVETRAVNRIGQLRPDAARRVSATSTVVAGGPAARNSRWPHARLIAAMRATGTPVRASIDAGDYLCNQALYLTLGLTAAPAGFIHVPKVGASKSRLTRGGRIKSTRAGVSLAMMAGAVEAAIVVMSVESRAGPLDPMAFAQHGPPPFAGSEIS